MSNCKITIEFPNDNERQIFLGWLSDGGGEDSFFYSDTDVVRFDYSLAFPAWGYDEEKHGSPCVVLKTTLI